MLEHIQDRGGTNQLLTLARQGASLGATCDLSLSPEQHRLLEFDLSFREAEIVRLEKLVVVTAGRNYSITHEINDTRLLHAYELDTSVLAGAMPIEIRSQDSTIAEILPKPPKVELHIKDLERQYYASQTPKLHVSVVNQELRPVTGMLKIETLDQDDAGSASISLSADKDSSAESQDVVLDVAETTDIIVHIVSSAKPASWSAMLTIQYDLEGESGTKLSRSVEIPLQFVKLFDLKWSFEPLLYNGDWPSYFNTAQDDSLDYPSGIPQRWRASLQAHSAASSAILIKSSTVTLAEDLADGICVIDTAKQPASEAVQAKMITQRHFDMTTQRLSADDRRPIMLNLICNVEWCVDGADTTQIFSMAVPRVSLPTSEPRVLCTVSPDKTGISDAVVSYHLENLSAHFLTFAIKMDPSEEFAYSGVKTRTLSLAPLSRVQLNYGLILHEKAAQETNGDGRWVSPYLQIIDSYYHKTLQIQPAGNGVKQDKDGKISVWIDN